MSQTIERLTRLAAAAAESARVARDDQAARDAEIYAASWTMTAAAIGKATGLTPGRVTQIITQQAHARARDDAA